MELLKVDTLEEARHKVKAALADIQMKKEKLPLLESGGYTLAEDIFAPVPVPAFCRSTVDGYAVKASNTGGATESLPVLLKCIGEVKMGERADFTLQVGQCVYVPTGGMIPEGADACVMIEYCEEFSDLEIAVYHTAALKENVVYIGEDMESGEKVLSRGERIRPQTVGVLASLGITEVPVYVPWNLTIISTGDELVSPVADPLPGQVRDINTYGICAQAQSLHFKIIGSFILKDSRELIESRVKRAMCESDIVVISGGSSKGKMDATAEVIENAADGGILTHGLALKPGKPTILGYDKTSQTILAGLPGHPAAAMLVFELLIKWLWTEKTGGREAIPFRAELSTNIPGAPGKRTCQLVSLKAAGRDGGYQAVPIWGKSGLIHTLAAADGYVMLEEDAEGLKKGETVSVYLLERRQY